MTATATATMDPTYGVVDGYTDRFDQFGSPSAIANVIRVNPSAIVQFVNLEPLGPQPSPGSSPRIVNHSAAGLPTAFPQPSYSFPPPEQTQRATEISASDWSTGPVTQDFFGGSICYSQTFSLPSGRGTYAFGDLAYFSLSNMRDVVVVSATARVMFRPHHLRRATPPP